MSYRAGMIGGTLVVQASPKVAPMWCARGKSRSPKLRDGDGQTFAKAKAPKKIFIVDDHPVFPRRAVGLVKTRPGWTVCGEADTAHRRCRELNVRNPIWCWRTSACRAATVWN